jgi:uncharacterized protein YkwD
MDFFTRRDFIMQLAVGSAALCFPITDAGAASLQSAAARHLNAHRNRDGLQSLSPDRMLVSVAEVQCRLMIANGRIGHSFGRGTTLGERVRKAGGRPRLLAENVARGQIGIAAVMDGWMKSPGHRRNMMHPGMREFGIAQISTNGRPYWALVLGG